MMYVTEATGHWIMAAYFVVVILFAVMAWREA